MIKMFDYFQKMREYKTETGRKTRHLWGFVSLASVLNARIDHLEYLYEEYKETFKHPEEVKAFIVWVVDNYD